MLSNITLKCTKRWVLALVQRVMEMKMAIPNSAFYWQKRNKLANDVIEYYVALHQKMDVGVGLAGNIAGLFIPGASFVGLAATLVATAPLVYGPMTNKLAHIYKVSPDEITRGMTAETIIEE